MVEVFWYGCPHCYALEPFIQSWMKNKPEYIQFVRVPVMWGPVHRAHARLFYTLQALGRRDLHQKVFDTIHKRAATCCSSNDEQATRKLQLDFAEGERHQRGGLQQGLRLVHRELEPAARRAAHASATRSHGVPLRRHQRQVRHGCRHGRRHQASCSQLINDLAASEKRR